MGATLPPLLPARFAGRLRLGDPTILERFGDSSIDTSNLSAIYSDYMAIGSCDIATIDAETQLESVI
jgi:hypothetical protein